MWVLSARFWRHRETHQKYPKVRKLKDVGVLIRNAQLSSVLRLEPLPHSLRVSPAGTRPGCQQRPSSKRRQLRSSRKPHVKLHDKFALQWMSDVELNWLINFKFSHTPWLIIEGLQLPKRKPSIKRWPIPATHQVHHVHHVHYRCLNHSSLDSSIRLTGTISNEVGQSHPIPRGPPGTLHSQWTQLTHMFTQLWPWCQTTGKGFDEMPGFFLWECPPDDMGLGLWRQLVTIGWCSWELNFPQKLGQWAGENPGYQCSDSFRTHDSAENWQDIYCMCDYVSECWVETCWGDSNNWHLNILYIEHYVLKFAAFFGMMLKTSQCWSIPLTTGSLTSFRGNTNTRKTQALNRIDLFFGRQTSHTKHHCPLVCWQKTRLINTKQLNGRLQWMK